MKILPIKCLKDNYAYILYEENNQKVIIIDAGESNPLLEIILKNNWQVEAFLATHHHGDHWHGFQELERYFPHAQKIGPSRLPHFSPLWEKPLFPCHIQECKGHTQDHLVFWFTHTHDIFTGDLLFPGTCGNLFEGDTCDLWETFSYFKNHFPLESKLWVGHEYSLLYFPWALSLEPWNQESVLRLEKFKAQIEKNQSTMPLLWKEELSTHPLLHVDNFHWKEKYPQNNNIEIFEKILEKL